MSEQLTKSMNEVLEGCMGDAPSYCKATCPLHVDAKGYIELISEGRYKESLSLIRETTPFPAILGRICAHPCEDNCKRQDVETALSVKNLKRFASTFDNENDWDLETETDTGKKAAIIGSGPAGAIAAYDLRKKGHQVTIFEALPVVGGMLRVGIPEYRLPAYIIEQEYSILKKLGVEIKLNTRVGDDISFQELEENYDAVFIAIGAHKSSVIPLDGTDLEGILLAADFLRETRLGNKPEIGKKVTVIGGGNVAMDVARTAWRLGAEEINLICLESREEMPAHEWEIVEAEEEGIKVNPGWGPMKFKGKKEVSGITMKKCLSVFDDQGSFNPTYDEGQTKELSCDNIILAIGQQGDVEFLTDEEIHIQRGNKIKTDNITLATNKEGVFAGGDIAGRPLLAIEAMAHGRKAAISIDRYLKGQDLYQDREFEGSYDTWLEKDVDENETVINRINMRVIPLEERRGNFKEVEIGFNEQEALEEAKRCLQCECKLCMQECEMLNDFCEYPKQLFQRFIDGKEEIDPLIPYSCNMCSQCTIVCPQEYEMKEIFMRYRKKMIKENKGKSPIKGHKAIDMHQFLGFSRLFNVSKAAPKGRRE